MFGGFAFSCEAKSASTSKAPSSSHSERAASALSIIQLQRLEQSVVSRLHSRQKAPRNQEFQHPLVLNEPLLLLVITQLVSLLLHPVHPSTLYSLSQG
ncbi:hypothetical protein EKA14_15060 [Bacillus mycoides]|nr:hypothetical protein EKA14_15060 [Bacillus mycoides]